jgi:hypothetical protein
MARVVLPGEPLEWEVDPHGLARLDQWRAAARMAEDQKLGRAQWHLDLLRPRPMIDTRKDAQAG